MVKLNLEKKGIEFMGAEALNGKGEVRDLEVWVEGRKGTDLESIEPGKKGTQ